MEPLPAHHANRLPRDVEQASGDLSITARLTSAPRQEKREASLHICRRRWPVEPLGSGGRPPGYLGRGWHRRKQQCLLIPPCPQGRCPANGHRFNLMARVQARTAQSEALGRERRESWAQRKRLPRAFRIAPA